MNDQPRNVKNLYGKELVDWIKEHGPLFTGSVEYEGMSLCYSDPTEVEEDEQNKTPPVKKADETYLPT